VKNDLAIFEGREIRRHYDEATETWWFSVVDIIRVLTQQPDYQASRKYWKVLKGRLTKEGSELVTNCYQLKMAAEDGKQRLTDAATAETLLRLVQSVPSPKAEPIKLWLARVGYERMQEMADPARSLARARDTWQKQGRSAKWIEQRMTGQETRNKLTDYWATHDSKRPVNIWSSRARFISLSPPNGERAGVRGQYLKLKYCLQLGCGVFFIPTPIS
jgi:DNA-damage-inducible protein D